MKSASTLPTGIVTAVAAAVLLNYFDRGSLATAAPVLQDQLSLSSTQVGLLFSVFFWTYGPSQLVAGWLVHRFEIRVVLAAGVALWASHGAAGLAAGFATILGLRLVLGFGESVTYPSWLLILSRHVPEHARGRFGALVAAGQGLGPMLGTLFGGLAMARFGWRVMFLGMGAITLLWIWPWRSLTRKGEYAAVANQPQRQSDMSRYCGSELSGEPRSDTSPLISRSTSCSLGYRPIWSRRVGLRSCRWLRYQLDSLRRLRSLDGAGGSLIGPFDRRGLFARQHSQDDLADWGCRLCHDDCLECLSRTTRRGLAACSHWDLHRPNIRDDGCCERHACRPTG